MKRQKRKIVILFLMLCCFVFTNYSMVFAAQAAPRAPKRLTAVKIKQNSAALKWRPSSGKIKAKKYIVYKNNKVIGKTKKNVYPVKNLKAAKKYKFYVKAQSSIGKTSKKSNRIVIKTAKKSHSQGSKKKKNYISQTPTPETTTDTTATDTATTETPSDSYSTTPIVGYYAAWAAYSGFTPSDVDATKLTHINYAFANIGEDLKITLGYPDIDLSNFEALRALKAQNPNLKTLISVGGWTWSGKYSDVALTEASRNTFADSVVAFLVQYGFDGVDIDWEYPVAGGLSTNTNRPEDKQNFTLLMQTLREKLDARGALDGKQYLLTFAGAATNSFVNNTELSKLSQYVDYATIMTYDLHGPWDGYTDLNAPLYLNSDVSLQYKSSVDAWVSKWLQSGFPANQLVMGIPFYGYRYSNVVNSNNGLYQTFSGAASISFATIQRDYLSRSASYQFYHAESEVPWYFDGSTFITYEDTNSVGAKANYIQTKGLGGAMIWELSQDPNHVLLDALYQNLQP